MTDQEAWAHFPPDIRLRLQSNRNFKGARGTLRYMVTNYVPSYKAKEWQAAIEEEEKQIASLYDTYEKFVAALPCREKFLEIMPEDTGRRLYANLQRQGRIVGTATSKRVSDLAHIISWGEAVEGSDFWYKVAVNATRGSVIPVYKNPVRGSFYDF